MWPKKVHQALGIGALVLACRHGMCLYYVFRMNWMLLCETCTNAHRKQSNRQMQQNQLFPESSTNLLLKAWKVSRQKRSFVALTLENWSTWVWSCYSEKCSSMTVALTPSSTTSHLCIQLGFNAPFGTKLSIELMDHGSVSQPQRDKQWYRKQWGWPKGLYIFFGLCYLICFLSAFCLYFLSVYLQT